MSSSEHLHQKYIYIKNLNAETQFFITNLKMKINWDFLSTQKKSIKTNITLKRLQNPVNKIYFWSHVLFYF